MNWGRTTAVTLAAIVLFASPSVRAEQRNEDGALRQAEQWLAVVDRGGYAESWEKAAAYFRNAVPKEQWTQSMNAFRRPLGKAVRRSMRNRLCATTLPGAPDGEYVIIQFDTSFENKKQAVETVTPMRESDGAWRVSGYFIK